MKGKRSRYMPVPKNVICHFGFEYRILCFILSKKTDWKVKAERKYVNTKKSFNRQALKKMELFG